MRSLLLENTQDACVSPPPPPNQPKKSLCSLLIAASPPKKLLADSFTPSLTKAAGRTEEVRYGWVEGGEKKDRKEGGGGAEERRRGAIAQTRRRKPLPSREVLPARDSSIVSGVENTAAPSYNCCSAFCAFALLIPTVSNTPPLHSPTLLFYHITRDVIHSHCLPFFADAICYG